MRIFLRAFEIEDYKQINEWRRDPEIFEKTGGNVLFVSSERDRRWVEDKILNTESNQYLAICLIETGRMIGYLSINEINWRNRSAEWGGILIGAKDLWNGGYATEAAGLMLRYVFFELGMHRIFGYWLESHAASIRMAEKLGFQREGLLRESVFKHDRYHSLVLMSLLKEEFERTPNGASG